MSSRYPPPLKRQPCCGRVAHLSALTLYLPQCARALQAESQNGLKPLEDGVSSFVALGLPGKSIGTNSSPLAAWEKAFPNLDITRPVQAPVVKTLAGEFVSVKPTRPRAEPLRADDVSELRRAVEEQHVEEMKLVKTDVVTEQFAPHRAIHHRASAGTNLGDGSSLLAKGDHSTNSTSSNRRGEHAHTVPVWSTSAQVVLPVLGATLSAMGFVLQKRSHQIAAEALVNAPAKKGAYLKNFRVSASVWHMSPHWLDARWVFGAALCLSGAILGWAGRGLMLGNAFGGVGWLSVMIVLAIAPLYLGENVSAKRFVMNLLFFAVCCLFAACEPSEHAGYAPTPPTPSQCSSVVILNLIAFVFLLVSECMRQPGTWAAAQLSFAAAAVGSCAALFWRGALVALVAKVLPTVEVMHSLHQNSTAFPALTEHSPAGVVYSVSTDALLYASTAGTFLSLMAQLHLVNLSLKCSDAVVSLPIYIAFAAMDRAFLLGEEIGGNETNQPWLILGAVALVIGVVVQVRGDEEPIDSPDSKFRFWKPSKEHEMLEEEVVQLRSERDAALQDRTSALKDNESLDGENGQLRTDVEAVRQEKETFEVENAQLRSSTEVAHQNSEALGRQIVQYKAKEGIIQRERELFESENAQLKREIAAMENEKEVMMENHLKLQAEIAAIQKEKQAVERQNEQMVAAHRKRLKQLAELAHAESEGAVIEEVYEHAPPRRTPRTSLVGAHVSQAAGY